MSDNESAIEKMVKQAAAGLSEHVDSVRIFVTYHEGDPVDPLTKTFNYGMGNFYATTGCVKEWVITQDTYAKAHAWKEQTEEDNQ